MENKKNWSAKEIIMVFICTCILVVGAVLYKEYSDMKTSLFNAYTAAEAATQQTERAIAEAKAKEAEIERLKAEQPSGLVGHAKHWWNEE